MAFLSRRAWNQGYDIVDNHEHEFIFRVSLPVYPWYKTEADVATIVFVRENTTIPVPTVYAFDSSADNVLGYEWILMERLPSEAYGNIVDRLSLGDRVDVAERIADWVDQLSCLRFNSICSLYFVPNTRELQNGRPVIQQFMGDWRHEYHHLRGPFHDLHSYLRSFMDCYGSEVYAAAQGCYRCHRRRDSEPEKEGSHQ